MTDRGSFFVQSEELRAHATDWNSRAADVRAAKEGISGGVGMGSHFGVLAGANSVTTYYNEWSRAMDQALADADTCFTYLEAALISAANDYDGVESTVVTDFSRLDGMV